MTACGWLDEAVFLGGVLVGLVAWSLGRWVGYDRGFVAGLEEARRIVRFMRPPGPPGPPE